MTSKTRGRANQPAPDSSSSSSLAVLPGSRTAVASAPARAAAPRPKAAEAEKITINLGFVDLGHIDLLVAERFYANRTDFIRTAIRNQLASHGDALRQVVARKMLVLGLQVLTADDLRAVRAANEQLHLRVLGLVTIAEDVTPELALATIATVDVLGALHASSEVKAALATRQL